MAAEQNGRLPEFVNCILIDRAHNNRQSHLPHVHENELELFYVYAGDGQYMVDNRYYPIREGDIVMEGRYSAENIGEDSLLLSLETEGRRSLWNCGIRTENSGRQTLVITGEVDGLNVSFIEK